MKRALLALFLALALVAGVTTAAVAQDEDGLEDLITGDEGDNETNATNDTNVTNATNADNETPQAAQAGDGGVTVEEAEVVNTTFFSDNQTLVVVMDLELSGDAADDGVTEQEAENITAAPGADNVSVEATIITVGTETGATDDDAEAAEGGETEIRVRLVFSGVTTDLVGGAAAALPPTDNATNATNLTNATNDTNATEDTNVTDLTEDAAANES